MFKQLLSFAFLALFSVNTVNGQNNGLAFDNPASAVSGQDYVSTPSGSSFVTGSSEMSLTCWVYPTNAAPTYPNYDGFAGFRNDVNADFFFVQISAAGLEGRFRNSTGTAFTITKPILTLNTWQHLALTYGNGWLKMYKNGVIVDSVAASGTVSNSAVPFLMGRIPYTSGSVVTNFDLSGRMDETSLWSRELQAGELSCLPSEGIDSTATGLELLYRCNQGVANGNNQGITSLIDATGNANGVLNGFAMSGIASNFVSGAASITTTLGFTCPDVAYNFNGQLISTAGIYTDTLVSLKGCDSIVQLQLNVLSVDTVVTLNWNTLTANHVGLNYQWLDCNNNYAPVAGATSRVFSPTVPGNYAVIVTQGACTDTSGCHAVVTVGIESPDAITGVKVQPTITSSTVKILFDKNANGITVSVIDFTGKQVLNNLTTDSREMEINLAGFASGVYFIKVSDDERAGMYKVVKQ
jgi:hypothetical protein